eukprot:m.60631 g.60631  ORF g.60631 m.60631 type:complete len:1053 (+) comp22861_c0_seq3:103-3261(+)
MEASPQLLQLLDAFKNSLNPDQEAREASETVLHQASQQNGFFVLMLQVITSNEIDVGIRLSAAVFLKNFAKRSWTLRTEWGDEQYLIPEQDKQTGRTSILEAMTRSPEKVRKPLLEVARAMLDEDFPAKWGGFAEKLIAGLASQDTEVLTGSIAIFYQITKHYRFEKTAKRIPYDQILYQALPVMQKHAEAAVEKGTPEALNVLRLILKVYYNSIQYDMPMFSNSQIANTVTSFHEWMRIFAKVLSMQVPNPQDDDRSAWPKRSVWKCKKWTCRTLHKMFARYGTPSQAEEHYQTFANMYTSTYSGPILELMWNQLKAYRDGSYIAPHVVSEILKYFENAFVPAQSWKMLMPLVPEFLQTIVLPLLCYRDEDEELWQEDPQEYIRRQLDPCISMSESNLPEYEATLVLLELIKYRPKNALELVFRIMFETFQRELAATAEAKNPRAKDGAMHMAALLGPELLKRKKYKAVLEDLLVQYVFPEFVSPHAHLRARACHVLHTFSEVDFKNHNNILGALQAVLQCLQDDEMPVRAQAAVALRLLLKEQQMARKAAEPYVKDIVLVLLKLMKDAESDDLAVVLDKMIEYFPEELTPYALQLLQALLDQFKVLSQTDSTDESAASTAREMACMGVMNTVQVVVDLALKEPKLLEPFEAILIPVMSAIITEGQLDFLDEVLALMKALADRGVSNNMWILFGQLFEAFKRECSDYFTEMCPFLYNCIREGMSGSNQFPEGVPVMIFEMCKIVWERQGEDDAWHAGKIMENLLSWCPGRVDQLVAPCVGLALTKLMDPETKMDSLKIMCVNVILAALRYKAELLIQAFESIPNTGTEPLLASFFTLWFTMRKKFTGIHNRKHGILTLCSLIQLPYDKLPPYIQQVFPHTVPMMLQLFEKLPTAYVMRAKYGDGDEEDDGSGFDYYEDKAEDEDVEDEEEDEADLADDQDYNDSDEENAEAALLIATLTEQGFNDVEGEEDEDELDSEDNDTYETPLDEDNVDEYVTFHQLLSTLQQTNANLANKLLSQLTSPQQVELQNVFKTALTRMQQQSKNAALAAK